SKPYSPPSPVTSPAPVAPSPVEPRKESTTMSSMPQGRFEPDNRGGAARIGKTVKVIGQIFNKKELKGEEEPAWNVKAPGTKVTIGPNGILHAAIKAREVVALGTIQGNVEATERIEIRKDAKLVGDIRTARIIIEDGAYFKGSIDIVKPEPAKAPSQKAAAAPPQQA